MIAIIVGLVLLVVLWRVVRDLIIFAVVCVLVLAAVTFVDTSHVFHHLLHSGAAHEVTHAAHQVTHAVTHALHGGGHHH